MCDVVCVYVCVHMCCRSVVKHSIVHKALLDFLTHCDESSRSVSPPSFHLCHSYNHVLHSLFVVGPNRPTEGGGGRDPAH